MDTLTVEFDTTTATTHQWVSGTATTPIVFAGSLITAGPTAPSIVPEDEIFFWMPEWQAAEHASMDALAAGRSREFDNVDEAIEYLLRSDE